MQKEEIIKFLEKLDEFDQKVNVLKHLNFLMQFFNFSQYLWIVK